MSGGLYVVRLGSSERLERLLRYALEGEMSARYAAVQQRPLW